MSVLVIVFTGKGDSKADCVEVKSFESLVDAESYCEQTTVKDKYWVHASLLCADVVYEPYRNSLFAC